MHVTGAKRGETRATKSRLVWILLLIGWENGANFTNQSLSAVKQNQSKRENTSNNQLKNALLPCNSHYKVIAVKKSMF